MNIEVNRINECLHNSPKEFIEAANADYTYRLDKIADEIIAHRDEKPVILLAGPLPFIN